MFDGNYLKRFNCIIHILTEECGGNVINRGVVDVTCSSTNTGFVKNIVDLDNVNNYFRSKDNSGSWIKYNFKEKRIIQTHYSIRSGKSSYFGNEPKDWVVEGSNDDNNYKTIDTGNGITNLCAASVTLTFDIKQSIVSNQGYKFIKLRQTGVNTAGNNHLVLNALEFFGILKNNS